MGDRCGGIGGQLGADERAQGLGQLRRPLNALDGLTVRAHSGNGLAAQLQSQMVNVENFCKILHLGSSFLDRSEYTSRPAAAGLDVFWGRI